MNRPKHRTTSRLSVYKARADISVVGGNGFFTLAGRTERGNKWMISHVAFSEWQGNVGDGLVCDDTRMMLDICEAAMGVGLHVDRRDRRRSIGRGQ